MGKRVVVTGYGAVTSMGDSVDEIWSSIMDYQLGYRRIPFDNPEIVSKYFGYIEEDRKRYKHLPKQILKMCPTYAKYAFHASHQALKMAFGESFADELTSLDPYDIGVIVGTGWGGLDRANDNYLDYINHKTATTFSTLMSMPSMATGAISMAWGLRGYQNTPVAACATGTLAIGDAYEAIRSGKQKVMLAGGCESLKDEFNVWSIDIMQALSKEQEDLNRACCPFDLDRSGFVLSEGAAILCIEELDHALNRGAKILGEITGYASFSDAYDMTAPAEDLGARLKSIEKSLECSGNKPSDINYINLHGTSTPLNDRNETNVIKNAFGEKVAKAIPMSSTKSYTGHLIGAAGSLESIFCLKSIETRVLPATINLINSDPGCDLNYIPGKHMEQADIDVALNLSFGFGGTNAALVIERY